MKIGYTTLAVSTLMTIGGLNGQRQKAVPPQCKECECKEGGGGGRCFYPSGIALSSDCLCAIGEWIGVLASHLQGMMPIAINYKMVDKTDDHIPARNLHPTLPLLSTNTTTTTSKHTPYIRSLRQSCLEPSHLWLSATASSTTSSVSGKTVLSVMSLLLSMRTTNLPGSRGI